MRVLIVDDEPLARGRLAALLGACAGCTVVGSVGDGEAALEAMAALAPDLLLLDIEMPGLGGTALAARLADRGHPLVVFTTAYEHHAIAAFELGAVDYLLKPVRLERLREALRRVQTRLDAAPAAPVAYLHARVRGEHLRIPLNAVLWLLAEEKYVRVRHEGGEVLLEESLRQLEEAHPTLLRLHRNCLVPAARLIGLRSLPDGRVLARLAGTEFSPEVSRRNLPALRRLLRMG